MNDERHLYSNIVAKAYIIIPWIPFSLSRLDPFLLSFSRYRGLLLHPITLRNTHSQTHTHTIGRTPLDKGSARRRDL